MSNNTPSTSERQMTWWERYMVEAARLHREREARNSR